MECDVGVDEHSLTEMLSNIEREMAEAYAPIFALGKEIMLASIDIVEEVKPFIPGEGTKKLERQVYVLQESIWFWAHIATRQVLRNFEESRFNAATECLSRFISQVAIASYFDHWSEFQKQKMEAEFLENLNQSLGEYSDSASRWNIFGYTGIFVDFAKRLVAQCGLEDQWEYIRTPLVEIIERRWKRATFQFTEIAIYKFVLKEESHGGISR